MTKGKTDTSTAKKILQAAEEVFVSKGFNGSSINEIATKAGTNKSLIYHHFENKAALWKAVKTNLLEAHVGKESSSIDFPMGSFEKFLESVVTLRFKFYDKNPTMVRLISWQRLEDEKEAIQGVQQDKLNSLAPQIKEFQRRGEVRQELDPQMVSYFIMAASSLPFMETPAFFQGEEAKSNKEVFLDMLIKGLYSAFSCPIGNRKENSSGN